MRAISSEAPRAKLYVLRNPAMVQRFADGPADSRARTPQRVSRTVCPQNGIPFPACNSRPPVRLWLARAGPLRSAVGSSATVMPASASPGSSSPIVNTSSGTSTPAEWIVVA